MLITLRSTLFYLGYLATLVVHSTFCVLVGWALPINVRFRYVTLWNQFAIWWLKITCGVHFRVSGQEHVPSGAFVLLSNHQSPWETIFLYRHFQPLTAILKRELLWLPFFGWALRLLYPIAIDRSKGLSARQNILTEGPKRLKMGLSVLVFPEGTRTEVGQERKYLTGGADLAIKAGALILPVAHNAGRFWPARKFCKHPGIIDVVIGKAIDATGREARELTAEVQAWINQALPQ